MTRVGKLFLWSSCLFSSLLSAQNFTIEQALSAPFSSQLTAAPAQGSFAWVTNQQGRRNLWVATKNSDSDSYSTSQLTKFTEDDGIEIGDIAWTPDAGAVVYVRGGDFEFPERPAPNPALLSGGVDRKSTRLNSSHGIGSRMPSSA